MKSRTIDIYRGKVRIYHLLGHGVLMPLYRMFTCCLLALESSTGGVFIVLYDSLIVCRGCHRRLFCLKLQKYKGGAFRSPLFAWEFFQLSFELPEIQTLHWTCFRQQLLLFSIAKCHFTNRSFPPNFSSWLLRTSIYEDLKIDTKIVMNYSRGLWYSVHYKREVKRKGEEKQGAISCITSSKRRC